MEKPRDWSKFINTSSRKLNTQRVYIVDIKFIEVKAPLSLFFFVSPFYMNSNVFHISLLIDLHFSFLLYSPHSCCPTACWSFSFRLFSTILTTLFILLLIVQWCLHFDERALSCGPVFKLFSPGQSQFLVKMPLFSIFVHKVSVCLQLFPFLFQFTVYTSEKQSKHHPKWHSKMLERAHGIVIALLLIKSVTQYEDHITKPIKHIATC